MSLRLGDTAPDFEQDSTEGKIKFHDWIGAGTQIELTLQRVAADTVAFRIASDVGSHASGRLVFGATT